MDCPVNEIGFGCGYPGHLFFSGTDNTVEYVVPGGDELLQGTYTQDEHTIELIEYNGTRVYFTLFYNRYVLRGLKFGSFPGVDFGYDPH